MKLQSISGQNFQPNFKAQFIKNDDIEALANYCAKDTMLANKLMVSLEMLSMKNKNTMLEYKSEGNGMIKIVDLVTGKSAIKINDFSQTSKSSDLSSLQEIAMPSNEQHQMLLGGGMSRRDSDEMREVAQDNVLNRKNQNPIKKEIEKIESQITFYENEKAKKTKDLILSKLYIDG